MGGARIDFWSTIAALLRRKRVVIPALLAALTLGYVAYSGTPPTYQSNATMILTTTEYGGTESQDPSQPTDLTNPMLNFNDSLRTTAGILIQAMSTKTVADQLGVDGPTRLVVNDGRTNPDLLGLNGPFLYVEATSVTPSDAKRAVADAQTLMRQKLRDWQKELNAPQKTFLSLVDVVPPSAPEPDRGRGTKLGLVAFLFGLILITGIAYFIERRSRRRAHAAAVLDVASTLEPPVGGQLNSLASPPSTPSVVAAEPDQEGGAPALASTTLEDAEVLDVATSNGEAPSDWTPEEETKEAETHTFNGKDRPVGLTPTAEPAVPAVARGSRRKPQLAIVRAPVKQKVRSRNR